MSEVIYTFYIEQNMEPQIAQTPEFVIFKSVDDGSSLLDPPEIVNLNDGYYKFTYTWEENSPSAWLLKIATGLSHPGDAFIHLKIEKHDYLPTVAESIKNTSESILAASNSLTSSADELYLRVNRLLDVQEGSWEIEGTELKIYAPAENEAERLLIATYQLYDSQGQESALNPFKRTLVNLAERGF